MRKSFWFIGFLAVFAWQAQAVERRQGVIEGTVTKVDNAAKTIVVKTADGTEHTLHFVKRTAVHTADATAAGSKDALHGVKEGSEVAVHYTGKGAEDTAEEVDHLGKNGLKASEGTVTKIDRGAKTVTVKTVNGTEETYKMSESAAKDTGKDVAEGTKEGAKATVYYTEEGGKRVAHFFKKAL